MPISYRIDRERNLVLTTATGVLTDGDILNLKDDLLKDKEFTPGMRELSDVRAVTDLRVTPQGVRAMAARDVLDAAALANYRLAIVATRDVVFGMARMYETLTESTQPHVGVFRELDEAMTWLGTSPLPRQ